MDLGVGRFEEAADFARHELPTLPHFDFFHAVALAMRAILKDYRRKKSAKKRGEGKNPAAIESSMEDKEAVVVHVDSHEADARIVIGFLQS